MKIKILKYQAFKGPHVTVQSHKKSNGVWKVNPQYEWHKKVSEQVTIIQGAIMYSQEITKEVN